MVIIFTSIQFICFAQHNGSYTIENVSHKISNDNEKKIDISYDLVSANTNNGFSVKIFISIHGNEKLLTAVTGNVGENIKAGKNKKITWSVFDEVGFEYGINDDEVFFRIEANDNILEKTKLFYLESTPKGVFAIGEVNNFYNPCVEYIKLQNDKYGFYGFAYKKDINTNNSVLSLDKYYTNPAPVCILFSMIMPGTGSIKATYGKKGWVLLVGFLGSAGLAISTKLYSDKQYNNYLAANDKNTINSSYNNANLYHKIALVSGSIACGIYIYDVMWVYKKVNNNLKNTKDFRNQLKIQPIEILKN